jgi:hypothetical protein
MIKRYDISVETKIFRKDGSLFADFGTFRWPGVDEEIRTWFAGSCSLTARWLIALPECVDGPSYTVQYRTVIAETSGRGKSDTTLIPFENLSYRDMIRFERWALDQLEELIALFERKQDPPPALTRPRSKFKAALVIGWYLVRNKLGLGR